MTPNQHYAEAVRLTALAEEHWLEPEGGYEPTTDPAELAIREAVRQDARAEALVYLAIAQVHATLSLRQPTTEASKPSYDPNDDFGAQYIAYVIPGSEFVEVPQVIGWGNKGEGWPDRTPVIRGQAGPEPLPFDPARQYAYGPTKDDAAQNFNKRLGGAA